MPSVLMTAEFGRSGGGGTDVVHPVVTGTLGHRRWSGFRLRLRRRWLGRIAAQHWAKLGRPGRSSPDQPVMAETDIQPSLFDL
jgi:hypothetical protein